MKKFVPYIIGIVVVLGGVGAYLAIQNQNKNKDGQASTSTNANDSSTAKKFTDACKVFTPEQLGAVFGGTFGAGEEDIAFSTATPGTPDYNNEDLQGSACKFDQDDDGTSESMAASIRLTVDIKTYKDVATATTYMNDLHSPQTAEGQDAVAESVDVSGVGDRAFFTVLNVVEQNKNESLNVQVGRQVVVLTVTQLKGLDQETARAGLTELGKKL